MDDHDREVSDAEAVSGDGAMSTHDFLKELAGAPPVSLDALDLVGRTVGHFEVLERVGRGGMGVVYRARDLELRRMVALKVLRADVMGDETRGRRLLREARAAAAVKHINVATIYEVGEHAGRIFIAMELVDGPSLRELVAEEALSLSRAVSILRGVLRAVGAAHRVGVVHRDLKPDNVMLDADGEVKVLDFGLAKATHVDEASGSGNVTETGRIIGTPGYMSPEQATGKTADARSDVFSIGIMFFEMLCGERPFTGSSSMDVIIATARDEPPTPSSIRAHITAPYDVLTHRCLEKDPAARYADAQALLEALDDIERGQATPPTRVTWVWPAASFAVIAAVAALYMFTRVADVPTAKEQVRTAPAAPTKTTVLATTALSATSLPSTATTAKAAKPARVVVPKTHAPVPMAVPSTARSAAPSTPPKVDLGI